MPNKEKGDFELEGSDNIGAPIAPDRIISRCLCTSRESERSVGRISQSTAPDSGIGPFELQEFFYAENDRLSSSSDEEVGSGGGVVFG